MDWTNDPATEQQLNLLRKLGFVPARPLSVTEAASLIRQYKKHPPASVGTPAVQPHPSNNPAPQAASPPSSAWVDRSEFSPGRRFFPLRQPAAPAHGGSPGGRESPEVSLGVLGPEVSRVDFWLDTCREPKEMQIASARVYELRQKYGRRFRPPSREQAQEMLDALDLAMPSWEKENPELFYRTLELNFPALARDTVGTSTGSIPDRT